MIEPRRIRYRFDLPDGSRKQLDLLFDPADFRLTNPVAAAADRPFWTELKFNQCANCPLDPAQHSHCPAAVHMAAAVESLQDLVSYDTVGVTVVQAERTSYAETTAQQAMSSVLGLIMASAGCPWTDHLRPMARFHLPFATEAETLYRSVSMFLLARELRGGALHRGGLSESESSGAASGDTAGFAALRSLYENLHIVNRDVSRRLGAAARTDPARNAIALLDSVAALLPVALQESLDELAPLFDAWYRENSAI